MQSVKARVKPGLDQALTSRDSYRGYFLAERLLLILPASFYFWRLQQGLHDDAVLFGLVAQGLKLLGGSLGRHDIERQLNVLKSYGPIFCDSQCAAKVQGSTVTSMRSVGMPMAAATI